MTLYFSDPKKARYSIMWASSLHSMMRTTRSHLPPKSNFKKVPEIFGYEYYFTFCTPPSLWVIIFIKTDTKNIYMPNLRWEKKVMHQGTSWFSRDNAKERNMLERVCGSKLAVTEDLNHRRCHRHWTSPPGTIWLGMTRGECYLISQKF